MFLLSRLPGDIQIVVIWILLQAHGGVTKVSLQNFPQSLQWNPICTLIDKCIQLHQHGL